MAVSLLQKMHSSAVCHLSALQWLQRLRQKLQRLGGLVASHRTSLFWLVEALQLIQKTSAPDHDCDAYLCKAMNFLPSLTMGDTEL